MSRYSKDTRDTKAVRRANRQAERAARKAAKKAGATASLPASTHIKGNTQGTSNEISFSVLHARRAAADGTDAKKARGVAATPKTMAEMAAEEARNEAHAALGLANSDDAARKAAGTRRGWKIAIVVVAVVAVAVAIAWGVFASINATQQRENQLTQAADLIEEADTTLFTFDAIVVSAMQSNLETLVADEVALRYELVQPTLAEATDKLARARTMIEQAQPNLTSTEDREAANEMLATLNARDALVAEGSAAMDETVVIIDLYEQVDAGWNGLLDADALARDAAALSGYATTATLQAALDKTQEAADAFATVRSAFSQAQQDVAEQLTYQADLNGAPAEGEGEQAAADDDTAVGVLTALNETLSLYLDYVGLRIDAQYEAERSTQAIIDHDATTATEANDAYNQLDSRAVGLIRGADDQPLTHVVALYDLERVGLFAGYEQARLRASQADAYLSGYLAA